MLSVLKIVGICIWGCLCVACYGPERSLSLDPHNKPLVHILESKYDVTSGTVLIKWEYIGTEPVTTFEVRRRILGSFEAVARLDGNRDAPNYVVVSSYQDSALIAGERVFYQVIAQLASGGQEQTQTANVTIPGAQALGVVRDPVNLGVQFRWLPDPGIASGYQVLRTIGNGTATVIYETNDPSQSSFFDEKITRNEPHQYSVRTLTQGGKTLESRPISAHFYRQATTQPVETVRPETERMRLSVGEPTTSGGTLALVARQNQLSLYQFRYQVGLDFEGSPRILRTLVGIVFPNALDFKPTSTDLAGPLALSPLSIFPRVYIGGILGNGQIDIVGFEMPLFNRVWSMPYLWLAPVGTKNVVLARDDLGRMYAAAGNVIQAFSDSGGFLGTQSLAGNVTDMSIQGDQIWVVFDGKRLERGSLIFGQGALSGIILEPVALPPLASILALAHNSLGQVVALDMSQGELVLFQANGTQILKFALPPGDYQYGDVVVDQTSGNLVQVTDGRGDVITFIP